MSTINERIAREVMGWLTHENWWLNEEGEAERTINNWKPDTNPADAMAVLKKCVEKCFFPISIEFVIPSQTWVVRVVGHECKAPTLEAAICSFALVLFPPRSPGVQP